jgi:hypothetical protein
VDLQSESSEVNRPESEAHDCESSLELVEVSATEFFSSAPQSAQKQASKAEGTKKCLHVSDYHRKSDRTIRRYKKAKRDLETQGFLSLPEFFKRKAMVAGQQDSQVVPSQEHKDKANEEIHDADIEVMRSLCSAEGSAASIAALEEEAEAEEEEEMVVDLSIHTPESIHAPESIQVPEEEEESDETENETDKANMDACIHCSAKGGTPGPSQRDPGLSGRRWGPSRTILGINDQSESDSETSSGNTAQSDPDELHSTETREQLKGLRIGNAPDENDLRQPTVNAPDLLRDRAGLQEVQGVLATKAKLEDLDPVLRGRIVAMVRLLNLFLDESLGYTWKKASQVVAKSEGRGTNRTRSIRQWVVRFMRTKELPSHKHGQTQLCVLNDENITHAIKEALGERAKNGFISATDVMEVVASPEIQTQLSQAGIYRPSIAKCTACRWLGKLGWQHGRHQNGMYADGHERKDVVEYRTGFVERFEQYARRFHTWDGEGNELPHPSGFPVSGAIGRFCLVLITHDESTFYQNDQRCHGSDGKDP